MPKRNGWGEMPGNKAAATAAWAALARGDLLSAYDIARRKDGSGDPVLDYLEVLVLARLGDHARALQLYKAYDLGAREDVDALALSARLLKDAGFGGAEGADQVVLGQACDLYAAVYARSDDAYPAINTATLAAILGGPRPSDR